MDYTTLGSTGLQVSVAGFGCGGNSRLGLGYGGTDEEAADLLVAAYDEGVTFIDTAAAYGTEPAVGLAAERIGRDNLVISTKARSRGTGPGGTATPEDIQTSLDRSLRDLRTDYIDVFHLHAVTPAIYENARNALYPVLARAKEAGKIRHIGMTESAPADPEQRAIDHGVEAGDPWEVVMLAYSMSHHTTGDALIPKLRKRGIGTLLMFAVRNIFSKPEVLSDALRALAAEGKVSPEFAAKNDPLGFLVHEAGAKTVMDAAYRFARWESGCDVILFGTGSADHMRDNVQSILDRPLPKEDVGQLRAIFGGLTGVGLDKPDPRQRTEPGVAS